MSGSYLAAAAAMFDATVIFPWMIKLFMITAFVNVISSMYQSLVTEGIKSVARSAMRTIGVSTEKNVKLNHDTAVFTEVAKSGIVGLGETYAAGYWEPVARLDDFLFNIIVKSDALGSFFGNYCVRLASMTKTYFDFPNGSQIQAHRCTNNPASSADDDHVEPEAISTQNILMSGLWTKSQDLDEALLARMSDIAEKLRLRPGHRVLDINCGHGALACYLAENNDGISITGIDGSRQQIDSSRRRAEEVGVSDRTEFINGNWGSVTKQFDRIVASGLVEQLSPEEMRRFFDVVARILRPDGVLLIHAITTPSGCGQDDAWVRNYALPDFYPHKVSDLLRQENPSLKLESCSEISEDYCKTAEYRSARLLKELQFRSSGIPVKRGKIRQFTLAYACAAIRAQRITAHEFVFVK